MGWGTGDVRRVAHVALKRSVRTVVAATAALLLVTQPAWADATLDTSTTLSTSIVAPSTVSIGSNAFSIRLDGTSGNVPSSKTGVVNVVNAYMMATDGVISPTATTTPVTFPQINYNQCPTTGTIPQGCPLNPFVVAATLTVAAGTPNNTTGALTVVATPDAASGVTADPTPAVGQVKVSVPNSAPTVGSITGATTVSEGSSGNYAVSAVDPDGDPLSYTWSVVSGPASTSGVTNTSSVSINFGDGPGTARLQVVVNDGQGHIVTRQLDVTVANVAPTATFNAPGSVAEGSPIALSLTGATDPSTADTAAGLQYAFDCGDGGGLGAFSATSSVSCPTNDNGSRTVKGRVRDKDGGFTEYTATVAITNVAPTATFKAISPVNEGSAIELSMTGASDPSSVDTAAGFQYAFDCGDGAGYNTFSSTSTASCPTNDNGSRTVKGEVRDKDGGTTEYTATVTINNVAPTATFGAPTHVDEGSNIALSLTGPSDPSSVDTAAGFTYAFDCGTGGGFGAYGASSTTNCATDDNGVRAVGGGIGDKDGGTTQY